MGKVTFHPLFFDDGFFDFETDLGFTTGFGFDLAISGFDSSQGTVAGCFGAGNPSFLIRSSTEAGITSPPERA